MSAGVVLDLFAGEGGATRGYQLAGYEVIAVDISRKALERNPAERTWWGTWEEGLAMFGGDADLIHASPPCQDYSVTKHIHGGETSYPRLIEPVRKAIRATGKHYVIENVEAARPELRWPTLLCGSHFNLVGRWKGDQVYLQRHRLFEASYSVRKMQCDHSLGVRAVTVSGHGRPAFDESRGDYWAGRGYAALCKWVMGIDWMTRDGLNEAIPPAYAEYMGRMFQAFTFAGSELAAKERAA